MLRAGKLDEKHRVEYEKDQVENRRKRLEESWPLAYPFAIAIETSNECNSKCIMCPRQDSTRGVGNMSMQLFRKIVDELHEYGVVLRKLFLHWLGEPLMHPEIAEMISYAQTKRIAEIVVMGTNAIKLNGQLAKALIEARLDELFISMDANSPETYSRIKGHDVHFDDIERNIRDFVRLKQDLRVRSPYVRLKMLKSEINAHEVDAYLEKWQNVVDEVYIEEDLNLWNGKSDRVNSYFASDLYVDAGLARNRDRFPCERLWYQLAITSDGYVSPCIADWNLNGLIGDATRQSLFEIWNQPVLVAMRHLHIEGGYQRVAMCSDCMRWIHRRPGDWIYDKDRSLRTCQ